jgi:hypothetical protein
MRTNFEAPRGEACLNQDILGASWNLPGLFVFDGVFFEEWRTLRKLFHCKLPIGSVSGSRNVLWNSGRVYPGVDTDGWTKRDYLKILSTYKEFGVNCFYTFSNNRLAKEHLDDRECNEMLEALVEVNHPGNGVILSSDLLSDYLREHYPSLQQKTSVIKSDMERPKGRDAAWYQDLAARFDMVVLQPDDNFKIDLLAQLKDQDKFEFLVNEPCVVHCTMRDKHYDAKSLVALGGYRDFARLEPFQRVGGVCGLKNYSAPDNQKRTKRSACRLSREELKELYDMGFRHFKLQGRSNQVQLAYDISYYMLDGHFFSNGTFAAKMAMILN